MNCGKILDVSPDEYLLSVHGFYNAKAGDPTTRAEGYKHPLRVKRKHGMPMNESVPVLKADGMHPF